MRLEEHIITPELEPHEPTNVFRPRLKFNGRYSG